MNTRLTVAGIGELLWDVVGDSEQLGGAPINFAYHINSLGGCGVPITAVGDDQRGHRALAELSRRGLNTDSISIIPGHPTGYVEVTTDASGVASYRFPPDLAWDHLRLNQPAKDIAARLDGVCFGTLGQRSPAAAKVIIDFIDGLPKEVRRICDLNLRQRFYSREIIERSMTKANILKLSDEELQVVAAMLGLGGELGSMLRELTRRYDLDLIILTRGPEGCLLLDAAGDLEVDLPAIPTQVIDTIGAGDSFTASVALGLLLGHPLPAIAEHANRLAAFVCSCRGAMPAIPDEFKLI